jgi:hypothetical protein
MVITSYQRLGMPLGDLLPAAESFTKHYMLSLEPAQVVAFLSSLANVRFPASSRCRCLRPASSQNSAMVLMSRHGDMQDECDVQNIRQPLVDAVKERLHGMPSSSISDVARAIAILDIRDPGLLQQLETRAVQDVKKHCCTSMCNIVWAFGKLKWHCAQYLSTGNQRLCSFLKPPTSMKPRDVAMLLWSFVQMEHMASHKVKCSLKQCNAPNVPLCERVPVLTTCTDCVRRTSTSKMVC